MKKVLWALCTGLLPFHVLLCSNAHRREIRQNLSVFLLALSEAPLILVQVGVEIIQHGHLLVQRDAHVVLHCVQRSQHQVENTHCMSESRWQKRVGEASAKWKMTEKLILDSWCRSAQWFRGVFKSLITNAVTYIHIKPPPAWLCHSQLHHLFLHSAWFLLVLSDAETEKNVSESTVYGQLSHSKNIQHLLAPISPKLQLRSKTIKMWTSILI